MTHTALVLAGQRPGAVDPVAAACGVSHKALAPVAGVPMLERVAQALVHSRGVGKIIVLIEAPDIALSLPLIAELAGQGRLTVQPASATPSRSVLASLGGGDYPYLVTTADHALLTPAMVEEFLGKSGGGDVAVALVSSQILCAAYPDSKRTWLRFSDGSYSGANLFAINGRNGRNAVDFWAQVEQNRKQPWRMVRALGPLTLLRFLLRRLSLAQVFAKASALFGARAIAVPLSIAEAAIDVDKVSDLRQAEAILARHDRTH